MKLHTTLLALCAAAAVADIVPEGGSPEIVGGTEVPVDQFKYITGLRGESDTSDSRCGGTLIAPKYVLTAAHCIDGFKIDYAAVGTHYLSGGIDGERIRVVKAIAHPQWTRREEHYDFGILELEHESKETPVTLSFDDDDSNAPGVAAKVRGWGNTRSGGSRSYALLEVEVKVWANDECAKTLDDIHESMICAGGVAGEDACQGDSGGPLTVFKDGKEVQIGVVSWGAPSCAQANKPGVYARLSSGKDFIAPYLATSNLRTETN